MLTTKNYVGSVFDHEWAAFLAAESVFAHLKEGQAF